MYRNNQLFYNNKFTNIQTHTQNWYFYTWKYKLYLFKFNWITRFIVIPDWWMTYGRVCFVNCSPTDSLKYTNIHISAHSWGFLTWKSLEILYHLPFKLISSHTNTHKIPWKKIKKIKTFLLKLDHGAMKMCSYSRTL